MTHARPHESHRSRPVLALLALGAAVFVSSACGDPGAATSAPGAAPAAPGAPIRTTAFAAKGGDAVPVPVPGAPVPWRPVIAQPTGPGFGHLPPAGSAEGCTKGCHADAAAKPGHAKLLGKHAPASFGCVSCHGGDPAASTAEAAHAPPGPTELVKGELLAAGCGGCHLPGSVPGTEALARGARLYLELGCHACHRAGPLGSEVLGPAHDTVGHRGTAYLSQIVKHPETQNPATIMLAFEQHLSDPKDATALTAYLLSQRGLPRPASPAAFERPCAACHAGAKADAGQLPGGHRCVHLRERTKELACARCHGAATPAAGSCAFLGKHDFACGACHGPKAAGVADGR